MLTNGQKRALHSAARQLGLADELRRSVQRRLGGFHSAADRTATRHGFLAVMAFFEKQAGGRLRGFSEGYWQEAYEREDPESALRFKARALGAELGMDAGDLDRFVASDRVSGGRARDLASAPRRVLRKLVEALKAMLERQRGTRSAEPETKERPVHAAH
ncbi:MAG TPA: hypothetical protein VMY69_05230 [Phycisphaerae bacterium]|nr:hypothetical protein [Phycisphaerae bacterium]